MRPDSPLKKTRNDRSADFELVRLDERVDAALWRRMVGIATPEIRDALGVRLVELGGGIVMVAEAVPSLAYNHASGFGLDAPVEEGDIDSMIACFSGAARFSIRPSPLARPAEIPAWLEARGLVWYEDGVRWIRGATDPPPPSQTDLRVERVDRAGADDWIEVAFTVFKDPRTLIPWVTRTIGMDGYHYYVARDGSRPVAAAALYVTGEVGWLGWGGTLPTHRDRGAQSALIARRLRDGVELGCRWFISETADDQADKSSPSYRNMARAGFRELCRRPTYAFLPQGGAR